MHKLLLPCLAISTCGVSPADGAISAKINGDSATKIVSTKLDGKPDGFATLTADQTILAREPGNRAALRDKIMTLARLGAAGLATDMSERNPGLLDQKERDSLAADGIASRIRWRSIAANAGCGRARFATLDQAIMESEAAGARALDPALTLSAVERQLARDFGLVAISGARWQRAQTLYVTHDPLGRITRVDENVAGTAKPD